MLKQEGYYAIFEKAGSRMEMPGCSLCMGNQARVEDNTTVFSTSSTGLANQASMALMRRARVRASL
ncbi:MAG: aconitase family protein [Vulcanococcus sp.]